MVLKYHCIKYSCIILTLLTLFPRQNSLDSTQVQCQTNQQWEKLHSNWDTNQISLTCHSSIGGTGKPSLTRRSPSDTKERACHQWRTGNPNVRVGPENMCSLAPGIRNWWHSRAKEESELFTTSQSANLENKSPTRNSLLLSSFWLDSKT